MQTTKIPHGILELFIILCSCSTNVFSSGLFFKMMYGFLLSKIKPFYLVLTFFSHFAY